MFDAKLKALVAELQEMKRTDPTAKALVFSQFNESIAWLQRELTRVGIAHRSIGGHMTATQRQLQLDRFAADPAGSVFLLSMRTGAVGLTLTIASKVFLLDPCLNPALEQQAKNRVYRIGCVAFGFGLVCPR